MPLALSDSRLTSVPVPATQASRETRSIATTPPELDVGGGSGQHLTAASLYAPGCPLGQPKVALWFGNERAGLSTELLSAVAPGGVGAVTGSGAVTVPMAGPYPWMALSASVAIPMSTC